MSRAEQVKTMWEDGMTVREIARLLDLSTQGVYYHLHRLGVEVPRKPQPASTS